MQTVPIRGAMRSGTNWFTELLERNFTNLTIADRSKHLGQPPQDPFLVLTKHPLSWWLSYWNWRTHPLWDAPRRIWIKANDLIGRTIPHYYNRKAIHDLKALSWAWAAWDTPQTTRIRYEDLLTDLDRELKRIAGTFDLERRPLDPVTQRVDDAGRTHPDTFDATRYTEEKWINDYTPQDLQRIIQPLERANALEQLEQPGYDLRRFL